MKNIPYLLPALLLLCLGLSVWNFINSRDKIVYVDTAKLFQQYSEATKINKKLSEEAKKYESNIDTLIQEIQSALKEYEKKGAKLDATSRAKEERLINGKQTDLARYQAVVKEKLEKQRNTEFSSVVITINDFLKEYGERKGYRMILIANANGTIAYAKDGTDITDDVINELNSRK